MNPENPTNPGNPVAPQESTPSVESIKPIQKRHSLRLVLSMMTVMVLVIGVFGAVTLSLQSQDNRSHASTSSSGTNYYGTSAQGVVNIGSSGGGGVVNIGGGGTGSLGLLPCINVIGIVVIGSCGTSQSSQPVPCGTAQTTTTRTGSSIVSIGSNVPGSVVNIGSGGSGGTSYVAPTLPCPTGAPPPPNPTSVPPYGGATTPGSYGNGAVQASLKVYLHGIGNGGDNVNPTSQGNMTPVHTQRTASVQVFNAANQLVSDNQAQLTYDAGNGVFKGPVSLAGIQTGAYTIKIKTNQYLRGLIPGIQNLSNGQTVALPEIRLVDGDVNGDNQVNILDYNILIGCYSDLSPAVSCTPENKPKSDLNDDDHVNQYDYNLFIRELSNVNGQ